MDTTFLAWLLLAASIAAEVCGNIALRHCDGFTRLLPAAAAGGCFVLAVWLMSLALRRLDMGLTYAVWAGCGTAITAAVGMAAYGEPASGPRLAGLACVVIGVAVLALGSR